MLRVIRRKNHFPLFVLSLLLIFIFSATLSYADDDDDDDDNGWLGGDEAKDIGYVSMGLFAAGMLNVIVLYVFKFTRKFLDDEGRRGKVKESTKKFYIKTRKPLNWFHYLATTAATTIVILHGIRFINKEEEVGIFGWIATGLFLLYIVTGIIIKLKIKPIQQSKIARRVLNIIHRNLVIFLAVVVLHIVHFLIAD